MLVVELDGDTHADSQAYDAARDAMLRERGYRILRFSDGDVHSNLEGVLTIVAATLEDPRTPTLSPEGEREKWY
jgi:very-short-patch-repair endonuclease